MYNVNEKKENWNIHGHGCGMDVQCTIECTFVFRSFQNRFAIYEMMNELEKAHCNDGWVRWIVCHHICIKCVYLV